MTIEVAQQGRALGQAVVLGLLLGVLYDLFRILRVRVRLPLLGPVLDLLFWLTATTALFLWSQQAWGGEIRMYGAVFCMAGGGAYFWLFSPKLLRLGYRLADLTLLLLAVLTAPLRLVVGVFKKIRKLIKNTFLFAGKWYRIRYHIGGMEQAFHRRTARERGVQDREIQASRFFDKDRSSGSSDLYGHLPAGSAWPDQERPEPEGHSGAADIQPEAGESGAD